MAGIKAHEFDRFIRGPRGSHRVFLVYGPDRGLVAERADRLAQASGIDLSDPFAVARLEADVLKGDPGRLIDEASAIGLFGGERIVRVKGAGNDRGLADALRTICDKEAAATVIVEGGDLKKGSMLRTAIEGAPLGLAIPCYADDERGIHGLIDAELSEAGLRITPGARDRLIESLGGDRLASRGELRKLVLYCMGRNEVSEDDVLDIVGDASAAPLDVALDAMLTGDLAALESAYRRVSASGGTTALLIAALRQFQFLGAMRAEIEERRVQAPAVMASMGRSIHFRRKSTMQSALSRWPVANIERTLRHLQATILECRRTPGLDADIARHAMLAIAQHASRLNGSPGKR